jgi:hypothetical protein
MSAIENANLLRSSMQPNERTQSLDTDWGLYILDTQRKIKVPNTQANFSREMGFDVSPS